MTTATDSQTALQPILRRVTEGEELVRLRNELARGARVISVSGVVAEPARALVVAALQFVTKKRVALITQANRDLESWERDVRFWYAALRGLKSCDAQVLLLPSSESDPYAGSSPHAETLEQRALALWRLANGQGDIVLLTARALARRVVSPTEIRNAGAGLKVGDWRPLGELVDSLIASGYVREEPVSGIGEFSMRGGILDVWSPGGSNPVRIEFFGDEIDSIRGFDPETQLSTVQLNEVAIAPMRELTARVRDFRDWADFARLRWSDEGFARSLKDRTMFADEGESFAGWEWLMPIARDIKSSVFDFLADTIFVFDEPAGIETFLGNTFDTLATRFNETAAADDLALRPDEIYLTGEELRARLERVQRIELRALGASAAATDETIAFEAEQPSFSVGRERAKTAPLFLFPTLEIKAEIDWRVQSVRRYHGQIRSLADDVRRVRGERLASLLFVMPSLGVAERVAEILREYSLESNVSTVSNTINADSAHWPPAPDPRPLITVGRLTGGFEMPSSGLIVHVESDLFDEVVVSQLDRSGVQSETRVRRKRSVAAAFLSDFRDLKVGDHVVHIDHGIARFGGLQLLDLGGKRGEFMLLFYADESKLYLPVERLDLVQRYSSAEGHTPKLDRLGGLGWQKTKAKAKRAMRDMADELLKLYAERKLVGGYAFAADSPWQQEFEDGFEYVLTPDQATSIDEVKRDMEEPVPMDRLLCGDVGYGKTEVAMRAAFKSVMDGKQVAVLTPTTVLAYQHFETFQARFAPFPAKVDLLSRFRSTKEQKETVRRIESGEVDIVIGTHRVLSKDVAFKELGLVVVDEEQRFGVTHKERLKHLKKRVDVLTLSATPIPRTLNMSLMGMRDMSVIETPPVDRLAIQTQVVLFSETVVKSAIELELGRGGQVFFIHNRVETIETIAALVKRLVPQARIAVGHGQMNEKEMERVMLDFVAYKFDVLVATTIIENGIDIPRANTIIINRADNYGLSQLYQLRGRVGRSSRRAYAYLLIPPEQELTSIARRRLAAIREFSDLGAGFRIAALDLELRGAGNFLGGEQSGHMDALGFDLYTQMLERTVAELRGEAIEDEPSVAINLGVDVAIPEDYIGDMGQRLRTYKRVSSARDEQSLMAIRKETEDRYGRLPESVDRLFEYARLRRVAEELRILSIDRTPLGIAVKFSEKARVVPEKLMELIRTRKGSTFAPSGVLRIGFTSEESEQIIESARRVLLDVRTSD